jgi:hypothetical protein
MASQVQFKQLIPQSTPSSEAKPSTERIQLRGRFLQAKKQLRIRSMELAHSVTELREFPCADVIVGVGDTATTLWLEKYHTRRGFSPMRPVIMLGRDFGSWRYSYTLAQRHSMLERGPEAPINPGSFVPPVVLSDNPHVDARDVYRSNVISLAETYAPAVLGVTIRRINRNDRDRWVRLGYRYHLQASVNEARFVVHARQIFVCTGLGPSRPIRNVVLPVDPISKEPTCSSEGGGWDSDDEGAPSKSYVQPPSIVCGNSYVLSKAEEVVPKGKTVVIYGGGGTAAACWRKAFFGHDTGTAEAKFASEDRKNDVAWVARNSFGAAGSGRLATRALDAAAANHCRRTDELTKVERLSDGKLRLTFVRQQMVCDQFVYAIGQDDPLLKEIAAPIVGDIRLTRSLSGVPTGGATGDRAVRFLGAAAVALFETAYDQVTWDWLRAYNVGPDVGPGSMPPSRAQVRAMLVDEGVHPQSVNANVDDPAIITGFLIRQGVDPKKAERFVRALVEVRCESVSGCSSRTLKELLKTHSLQKNVTLSGHGQLVQQHKRSNL